MPFFAGASTVRDMLIFVCLFFSFILHCIRILDLFVYCYLLFYFVHVLGSRVYTYRHTSVVRLILVVFV